MTRLPHTSDHRPRFVQGRQVVIVNFAETTDASDGRFTRREGVVSVYKHRLGIVS